MKETACSIDSYRDSYLAAPCFLYSYSRRGGARRHHSRRGGAPALQPARRSARALVLAIFYTLSFPAAAAAQIDPDDTGAGTKLGLAQQRNSGQVGTVTLFALPPGRTLVVLALASAPARESEVAQIRRGRSCRTPAPAEAAVGLAPVAHGESRSEVQLPLARLLSGNYLVEVFGRRAGARVACGQLYHSGRTPGGRAEGSSR